MNRIAFAIFAAVAIGFAAVAVAFPQRVFFLGAPDPDYYSIGGKANTDSLAALPLLQRTPAALFDGIDGIEVADWALPSAVPLVIQPEGETGDIAAGEITIIGKDWRGRSVAHVEAIEADQTEPIIVQVPFSRIDRITVPEAAAEGEADGEGDPLYGATYTVGIADLMLAVIEPERAARLESISVNFTGQVEAEESITVALVAAAGDPYGGVIATEAMQGKIAAAFDFDPPLFLYSRGGRTDRVVVAFPNTDQLGWSVQATYEHVE